MRNSLLLITLDAIRQQHRSLPLYDPDLPIDNIVEPVILSNVHDFFA
jgi:hypothetical protein